MKRSKKVKNQVASRIPPEMDFSYFSPLQVVVRGNFEKAAKIFRSKVQQDKVLSTYKQKQSYEKPSEKKRRKHNENMRRLAETDDKQRKMLSGEYDREKNKKQSDREKRMLENQVDRKIVEK